jgi:hypothetical protein
MVPHRRKLSAILGTPVAVLLSSRVVAIVTCVIFRVSLRYIVGSLCIGRPEARRLMTRRLRGPDFRTFSSCLRLLITRLWLHLIDLWFQVI